MLVLSKAIKRDIFYSVTPSYIYIYILLAELYEKIYEILQACFQLSNVIWSNSNNPIDDGECYDNDGDPNATNPESFDHPWVLLVIILIGAANVNETIEEEISHISATIYGNKR